MKKNIINIALKLGALRVARFLTRKRPRIFMYHSFSESGAPGTVSQSEFEWQVDIIKRHFNPITLIELTNLINQKKKIPNNTIVLTIDDGYKNFYDIAYPILKKYNVPATFFVATGFINKELWLWPDQLKWLIKSNENKPCCIMFKDYKFTIEGKYQSDWQKINDFCLSITDTEKHECIIFIAKQLSIELPTKAPDLYAPCSWIELDEMEKQGIEIGGHTITHPSLPQVTDDAAIDEIKGCLTEINRKLGNKERTFCYPNGSPKDYNERIKLITKEAGFLSAVTAFNDSYNLRIPYAWRRFDGGNNRMDFSKSLYGFEYLGNWIKKIKKDNL
jgi:peptidoglycan/xylan/chitin deacetylase (PgdA/CDA1 family)